MQHQNLYNTLAEIYGDGPGDNEMKRIIAAHEKDLAESTKDTIEERKYNFGLRLIPYANQYPREMLKQFRDYWCEHNENGRKMRFEMQKVFNLKLRLKKWHEKSNNGFSKARPNTDDAVNWAISQLSGKDGRGSNKKP